jgi:hypothetical protein
MSESPFDSGRTVLKLLQCGFEQVQDPYYRFQGHCFESLSDISDALDGKLFLYKRVRLFLSNNAGQQIIDIYHIVCYRLPALPVETYRRQFQQFLTILARFAAILVNAFGYGRQEYVLTFEPMHLNHAGNLLRAQSEQCIYFQRVNQQLIDQQC